MTLEQRRARSALARVTQLEQKSADFKKLYRAYVDRLGPAIVMNGLGQALAAELAAAGPQPDSDRERAHRALYDSLNHWLCREERGERIFPNNDDLLRAITANPESCYLHAQAEALAWLEWHKKFCRASFPKGEAAD